jgi:hypothetical protein
MIEMDRLTNERTDEKKDGWMVGSAISRKVNESKKAFIWNSDF